MSSVYQQESRTREVDIHLWGRDEHLRMLGNILPHTISVKISWNIKRGKNNKHRSQTFVHTVIRITDNENNQYLREVSK
jgi:hypothetical protein